MKKRLLALFAIVHIAGCSSPKSTDHSSYEVSRLIAFEAQPEGNFNGLVVAFDGLNQITFSPDGKFSWHYRSTGDLVKADGTLDSSEYKTAGSWKIAERNLIIVDLENPLTPANNRLFVRPIRQKGQYALLLCWTRNYPKGEIWKDKDFVETYFPEKKL